MATTLTASNAHERVCGICKTSPGKYKCGKCTLPFCSVPCSRLHRESSDPLIKCTPPPPAPASPPRSLTPSAKRRKPNQANPYAVLEDSEELDLLFKKYPNLPSQLLAINAATEPPATYSEFTNAMPSSSSTKEYWNHDVGIRKGKEALRKAREATGDEGEGVREYYALVLKLLNERSHEGGEGSAAEGAAGSGAETRGQTTENDVEDDDNDITALLRRQLAAQDRQVIKGLMEVEGSNER